MTEYRADIDGLRAVAIMPVLLFHAGFVGGGFIGVDVFFVVSGYLITRLIAPEIRSGSFSLLEFYARRARRLLPALSLVLVASAVAACVVMVPSALEYFGGSLFATAVFASNVFFWLEAGYFDTASEAKPLLHTWSLAVEEQFYLLFPLLLMWLLRRPASRPLLWTNCVLVVSLCACVVATRYWPDSAFYLTPYRAWELAIGVWLALSAVQAPQNAVVRNALAWAGIGLILAATVLYSWRTPFPGLAALAPTVGAALVVWTGSNRDTTLKRLLSMRPVVFVGLISYSLYLWHWPLLAFARIVVVRHLTPAEASALLFAAFLLASLSWKYVELPIRQRRMLGRRSSLLAAGAASIVALAIGGLVIVVGQGWPQRLDPLALRYLHAEQDENPRREECSFMEGADLRDGRACRIGSAALDARPTFAVWGDSHADALLPAFDRLADEHHASGLYLGKIGCPPLLDVERTDRSSSCREFNAAALQVIERSAIDTVVIVARWAHYTDSPTVKQEPRTLVLLRDAESNARDGAQNTEVLARGLERTLSALRGRRVFVVDSIPEVGYHVPRALATFEHLDRRLDLRPTTAEFNGRQREIDSLLTQLARRYEVELLRPADILCDERHCAIEIGDDPLYSDEHHLSAGGALAIAPLFEPVFAATAARQ
jgi:peptidoglycan/LPS O-acetylase OafA/YrhL